MVLSVTGSVRAARYLPLFALTVAACTDDGTGGGGSTSGSSGTGGLGPIEPGGPMPNCTTDAPSIVPVKERRWLYVDAKQNADGPVGRYLVELTPNGPEGLTLVAEGGRTLTESWTPGTWSADGRYFAFTRSGKTGWLSIEVLEVSEGAAPVAVEVPHHPGNVHWSPTDARFYVLTDQLTDAPVLSLTDVTNGTEKNIELSGLLYFDTWSPDGRYIALSGDGVTLIDTAGDELVAIPIPDSQAGDVPEWSPGGRYLSFKSRYDVVYYDVETEAVGVPIPLGDFSRWIGDGLLLWQAGLRAYLMDVTEETPRPVPLRGGQNHPGFVSPGGKCILYDGFCGHQVSEYGLCVRTLPPDPTATPVRVHDDGDVVARWSGSGDRFAFGLPDGDGNVLVHVALDGSELNRELILEPSHSQQSSGVWNPSGESNWFGYFDQPLRANGRTEQRLWHRETRQTTVVGGEERSTRNSSWSADGRYLAIEIGMGWEDPEPALEVYEVLEDGLGRSFALEGIFPSNDTWEHPWQP